MEIIGEGIGYSRRPKDAQAIIYSNVYQPRVSGLIDAECIASITVVRKNSNKLAGTLDTD